MEWQRPTSRQPIVLANGECHDDPSSSKKDHEEGLCNEQDEGDAGIRLNDEPSEEEGSKDEKEFLLLIKVVSTLL